MLVYTRFIVKSQDLLLLGTWEEHTVKLVTIWSSGKKLFTFEGNFQDDLCLVKTAKQSVIHAIETTAGPLALVDTCSQLLRKSDQMMQILEVLFSLGDLWCLVSQKKLLHIYRLFFFLSLKVESIKKRPKRDVSVCWKPRVVKCDIDFDLVQCILNLVQTSRCLREQL